MFNHQYPYSDMHEFNLDWLLARYLELSETVRQWIVVSEVKFADPIEWSYKKFYPKNTIVLGEDGNTYITKKDTPAGIPTTNADYWLKIGNYNAQYEEVTNRVPLNYEMFGAVLDGVTDDSEAVQACHAFANATGRKVEQHTGRLLLNFSVNVKTDCDFSGLTFIMDDNTPQDCYIFVHDTEVINKNMTLTHDMVNTSDNALKGYFCVPYLEINTTSLGIRGAGSGGEYFHRQPLAFDNLGVKLTAPYELVTATGLFTLEGYSKIDERGCTFNGGHVINNMTVHRGFNALVTVMRNNCRVSNITVTNTYAPVGNVNTDRGVVRFEKCCNGIIDGVRCLNSSDSVNTSYAYCLTILDCYNINVINCFMTQGWGAIATYFTDTIKFDKCTTNRIDSHYGIFGSYSVSDCTLTGGGNYVSVGYGSAKVFLDRLVTIPNAVEYDASVVFRNDFPEVFNGDMLITNCFINSKGIFYKNSYNGSSSINDNFANSNTYPNIKMVGCELRFSNSLCNGYDTEFMPRIKIFASLISTIYSRRSQPYVEIYGSTIGAISTCMNMKAFLIVGCAIGGNIENVQNTLIIHDCRIHASIIRSSASLRIYNSRFTVASDIQTTSTIEIAMSSCDTAITPSTSGSKKIQGCYNIN